MDNDALINGYFEGTLSKSERDAFDLLLKTDEEFTAQFEFERELRSALKKEERQEIRSMFSKLGTETIAVSEKITPKETKTKVISIRPWLVAACVLFLLGLGSWFLFFNTPNLNAEQLYAANFAPYENVVHPIERGEQREDIKTRAFTAYEDQDYVLALELFKELQIQHADPYIDFYEAIVLMQLDNHKEAVPLFEGYIEKNGQLKDRARWYLALAYLKLEDLGKSKKELANLMKSDGFKAEAAKKLLLELE